MKKLKRRKSKKEKQLKKKEWWKEEREGGMKGREKRESETGQFEKGKTVACKCLRRPCSLV